MTRAYLGIGSNRGDRLGYLKRCVSMLKEAAGIEVVALSGVYRTDPVGVTDQPEFLNAVVEVETSLGPRELLMTAMEIERRCGRVRAARWGPRTLDVDLLLYGGREIKEADLIVPHPELTRRRFVLEPLVEIAPRLSLPDGTPVSELTRRLGPACRVERDPEMSI